MLVGSPKREREKERRKEKKKGLRSQPTLAVCLTLTHVLLGSGKNVRIGLFALPADQLAKPTAGHAPSHSTGGPTLRFFHNTSTYTCTGVGRGKQVHLHQAILDLFVLLFWPAHIAKVKGQRVRGMSE